MLEYNESTEAVGKRMKITGRTLHIPIVGHPVAGVYTPPHVNDWLRRNGIDAVMTPLDIAPEMAAAFFELLRGWSNLAGCSVTHPYKESAFAAVDTASARAGALRVVNTIRRDADGTLHGDMTDGAAMVAAMRKAGCDPSGKSACVVGAGGGAGRAIVAALCEAGIARLELRETDPERREAVAGHVLETGVETVDHANASNPHDIVVNATTLGSSSDDPLPVPASEIVKTSVYCDAVNAPTHMLSLARERGAKTVSGADMGAEQIELQMGFVWQSG